MSTSEYGNRAAMMRMNRTNTASSPKAKVEAKTKATTGESKTPTNSSDKAIVKQSQNTWNPPKINANVGGSAKITNIRKIDQIKIQQMADKHKVEITVIGSQARGTAHPESDWDFIVSGQLSSKARRDLMKNLPKSPVSRAEMGRDRLEVFDASDTPLRTNEAYITFKPNPDKQ
nr:nucleotidyltransferase domain-containing protein [uncultured Psychroserpens sp.]